MPDTEPYAEPSIRPALTELVLRPPGPRRWAHALAYQAPWAFAGRALQVGAGVAVARVSDAVIAHRLRASQVLRSEAGGAPAATGGRRVALYLHYAASGHISPMVREQVASYQAAGFDVVFASNAERIDEASWQAVAPYCWRLIWRRNVGFDFGAWRDSAALLLAGQAPPDELLLINDSVLGPFHPLEPLFARARTLGAGVVGLTESRQGGVHLQSYFLLALGTAAVSDMLDFLLRLHLSQAKWLTVHRGELGLTRHLAARGHAVAALFGYEPTLDAVLASPEERNYLATLAPKLTRDDQTPQGMRQALIRWPLNPTSHLWRGLPRCLGFPFLKVALIRRNTGRLPGVAGWPALLEHHPHALALARDHLATPAASAA